MPATDPFHALILLNSVFASTAWCLARPNWPGAVTLSATSILWLFFNHPIEGRVLYSIDYQTGLTESDLVSAAGLLLAVVTVIRIERVDRHAVYTRRRRTQQKSDDGESSNAGSDRGRAHGNRRWRGRSTPPPTG